MALTSKQEIAVNAYLGGMDRTAACRAAGYARPQDEAATLFKTPSVAKAIANRQKAIRRRVAIEIDDVLEGLMEAVHAAQNSMEMVAAWREIGRIIGAYEHAKRVEVKIEHKHIKSVKQLERLSDKDLAELAALGDSFTIEDAEYSEIDDDDTD